MNREYLVYTLAIRHKISSDRHFALEHANRIQFRTPVIDKLVINVIGEVQLKILDTKVYSCIKILFFNSFTVFHIH